ncbi:RagB/SusD family nutrient uptake outer membrane protein [Pinibacter aurantiacus]|uniref:RagB/SusD family nutrient uptake outer membrane protein n=1 Tax=Pinibacter aurantiacus TaxID=2851599 RepID=A0A9E2SCN6_9BACT|nr:RagB/SusD family nutrient uptake outer membrane protein [Pinibacter aurantiacus]MBV4360176.1 RagB/SusD family nutrient uptake outer membrane protein [Pinibacter aurantiacus]
MKKLTLYISVLLLMIASLSSCKKWLDVKPENVFTEQQIFSTPQSVYQALNGIYLSMSKSSMYGANLTMLVPDVMAQYYNVGSSHKYYNFSSYGFSQDVVKTVTDEIWTSSYVCITNANSFVAQLDKYKGVVTPSQDSILRGEAIALRAFFHFDMLRLFGPMYNTADSILPSIPYYKKTGSSYNGYLPGNNVMDSVLDDLKTAEALLSNDPVITFGVAGNPDPNTDAFFRNRNLRMNYYAVKALQARVYMYRNDKANAYQTSQLVIANAQKYFPWITSTAVLSNKDNADRLFSTEMIFAVQSLEMYGNYNKYFAPANSDGSILAPLDGRLNTMMESSTYPNDYRLNPCWIYPTASSKSYRTFYKFADVSNTDLKFRYMMPLIRISEMYYIAAETAPDNATAFGLLNTVRYNRGDANIPGTAVLATEIKKEYQKEFYGEGQLFYYYKRTKTTAIPNGSATSGNVTMDKTKYVVPIPQSETNFH